jgi:ATP-dependent DNA ligase
VDHEVAAAGSPQLMTGRDDRSVLGIVLRRNGAWIAPLLARSGRKQPINPAQFAVEPKWDGWRGIVCLPRTGSMFGAAIVVACSNVPQLAAAPAWLDGRTVMLDGEIVAFDKAGKPDFHRLGFGRGAKAPSRSSRSTSSTSTSGC